MLRKILINLNPPRPHTLTRHKLTKCHHLSFVTDTERQLRNTNCRTSSTKRYCRTPSTKKVGVKTLHLYLLRLSLEMYTFCSPEKNSNRTHPHPLHPINKGEESIHLFQKHFLKYTFYPWRNSSVIQITFEIEHNVQFKGLHVPRWKGWGFDKIKIGLSNSNPESSESIYPPLEQ